MLAESEMFPFNIAADVTIENDQDGNEIEKEATQKGDLQVDVILNFPSVTSSKGSADFFSGRLLSFGI